MTWFKVDDGFHSHPKTRKVLAKAPAALALWVVAGSWSSDNLTDGLIPEDQLPWLIPDGAEGMAQQLVAARFWKRVRGGYQFHQWVTDGDGTKRNPTREEIEAERRKKAEAGRKGGLARAQKASTGQVGKGRRTTNEDTTNDQRSSNEAATSDPRSTARNEGEGTRAPTSASGNASSTGQAGAKAGASGLLNPPTRPDPKGRGGTGRSLGERSETRANTEPPNPRCEQHIDVDDPPPCGPCADARRARTRWDLADAERRRTQPKCQRHRGQPAHNCGLCRADDLAQEDA